jgi:hypothetical protein
MLKEKPMLYKIQSMENYIYNVFHMQGQAGPLSMSQLDPHYNGDHTSKSSCVPNLYGLRICDMWAYFSTI